MQAIFLGIIQGLTEFLPVSSSGHLVIAQSLLPNFSQPGVLFDVILHGGTLLAVVVYFRKNILSLNSRMIILLILGSIPAGLAGFFFKDFFEALFLNPRLVAIALLFTGVMNWLVDGKKLKVKSEKSKSKGKLKWKDAMIVGVFQALAIIPGISRSGSTIFAGVFCGISRTEAATFSFLLSIPAVGGAILLQLTDYAGSSISYSSYFAGWLAALVVGYISIGILMKLLRERRFRIFAIYCWVAGLTTLVLAR